MPRVQHVVGRTTGSRTADTSKKKKKSRGWWVSAAVKRSDAAMKLTPEAAVERPRPFSSGDLKPVRGIQSGRGMNRCPLMNTQEFTVKTPHSSVKDAPPESIRLLFIGAGRLHHLSCRTSTELPSSCHFSLHMTVRRSWQSVVELNKECASREEKTRKKTNRIIRVVRPAARPVTPLLTGKSILRSRDS